MEKCDFNGIGLWFINALRGINFLFSYSIRKHDKAIICDEIEKFSENLLMLKWNLENLSTIVMQEILNDLWKYDKQFRLSTPITKFQALFRLLFIKT